MLRRQLWGRPLPLHYAGRPPEAHWHEHTPEVARALTILERLALFRRVRGRTDEVASRCRFGVKIQVTEITPLPEERRQYREDNDLPLHWWFVVTDPDDLCALAEDALRRALEKGIVSEVEEPEPVVGSQP